MTALTPSVRLRCDRLRADLVSDARLVLADLDGCLVSEGQAFPDAAAFVEACGDRLWVVSNNSTDTADALAAALRAMGLGVDPRTLLLAGEQTLRHLAATGPGRRLALYASAALHREARRLGLRLVTDDPEIVLVCRDLAFALADIATVAAQLRAGARLWVSNTDAAHPGMDGRPVPETGALLAAIRAVVGPVAFECLGKPHLHLARIALERTGIRAHEAVFVGDNAATDGALAQAAGIPFLHLVRERAP